ncbi:MAG: hypothetical protein N2114_01645, partial [Candidatus Goldbacteria bacterium]|nr:hypothetical protein [Candidatus Goldiibacteriota bacterium]
GIFPDLKGILFNIIQIFLMVFLPKRIIVYLYFLWRIKKNKIIVKKKDKKSFFYKYRLSFET